MTRALLVAAPLVFAAIAAPAAAQIVNAEADVTAGHSTDGTGAGAVQARVFGVTSGDWRYLIEGAWGQTTALATDAFGGAYPYDHELTPIEAYAEKWWRPSGWTFVVRGGRYRTPFGISSRGENAYSGFTRAPLMRYGGNFALSNDFLDAGADVLAGTPRWQVEASVGTPSDVGDDGSRRRGAALTVRVQATVDAFIVGASATRAPHVDDDQFSRSGDMRFGGVDARWMRAGVELAGEWIAGRPFDGGETHGGYIDLSVHRLGMGPVTIVARGERLDYGADVFSLHRRRLSAGTRVRLFDAIAAEIDWVHDAVGLGPGRRSALDASVTLTVRR